MIVMKKISVVLMIVSMLSACSNQPKQVTASIPLVDMPDAVKHDPIPEKYWGILDEQPGGFVVNHDAQQVILGGSYFSALGHKCRELLVKAEPLKNTESDIRRVVCQPPNYRYWYLVPDIMRFSNQSFSFK